MPSRDRYVYPSKNTIQFKPKQHLEKIKTLKTCQYSLILSRKGIKRELCTQKVSFPVNPAPQSDLHGKLPCTVQPVCILQPICILPPVRGLLCAASVSELHSFPVHHDSDDTPHHSFLDSL